MKLSTIFHSLLNYKCNLHLLRNCGGKSSIRISLQSKWTNWEIFDVDLLRKIKNQSSRRTFNQANLLTVAKGDDRNKDVEIGVGKISRTGKSLWDYLLKANYGGRSKGKFLQELFFLSILYYFSSVPIYRGWPFNLRFPALLSEIELVKLSRRKENPFFLGNFDLYYLRVPFACIFVLRNSGKCIR